MDATSPTPQTAHHTTAASLAGRQGFNEQFLGVPVPVPALAGIETALLPYTHVSVLMRPDKRLAAVTALGIDGAKLMDLDRSGNDWRLDPRLPEDQQTGERVYARNDIDRGHLVRRASAVWGDTRVEAATANETPSTTRTLLRRPRSSTRAWISGWASSRTSSRTPRTTAGA